MKKFWYGLFAAVFFLACLIPTVGMAVFGPSEAAANELPVPKPRLVKPSGVNGEFLSDLQNYVNNCFFLRLEDITGWDKLCAGLFGVSANEDVMIGPDGWLFYGEGVGDMTGSGQMSDRQIWSAARSAALMQEYTQSQGADFLFTVVCGKYTLYPEHAPSYVTVAEGSNRERLNEALAAQGVNYVNLYDVFAAQDETLYWQWDSHWHGKGAALAADALMEAMGRPTDYFAGPFTQELTHRGDLYEMLYPKGKALEADYVWEPGFTFGYTSAFHSADDITIETENPGAEGSLLMFRDSSGRSLYPYMAQSFGRAHFSRLNNYRLDYVNQLESTQVVVEIAERTLDYLLDSPAVYPAPVRDREVLAGAETVESVLHADEPNATMEGYYLLSGTLPETAVDSPVYVLAGETVYEAIPSEGSFTLWLPAGTDAFSAQVYAFL